MTTRKQHIAEMQYALANNCTLLEARQAMATIRQRAGDELLREVYGRPVVTSCSSNKDPVMNGPVMPTDAPWMMRD
jgi:hypothetical protein